ncbi:polysaccharide deacetylase family protein [Streptomyces sp. NPDC046805]|uniref:polysaccharide deacetylase family protein n=1 Tax=Streptomyces sp. NPDC046805 TaxID=3155134 RepID=UPI0034104EC5
MTKDQLFTRRRALLAGAAALGAVGTAGLVFSGTEDTGPAPQSASAPGPQARPVLKSSTYRLQPLVGDGPPAAAPTRLRVRHAPILRMSGAGRHMLLTFDDGPDPEFTPHILDTLAQYDVRATFFVCGGMADLSRDLVARIADEGHVVGNHTWSHPLLTQLRRSRIRSEMERTSDLVEKACGERPRWFRAPYGAWNRDVFQLGAEMGMEPLAWTVDSLDWTDPGTRIIVRRVEDGAAPGVVVLNHDAGGYDRAQTVNAVRTYLPRLLDDGYHMTVPRREYI